MSDLTGAVETLQEQQTFLAQQLLTKVDLDTMKEYSSSWNTQFTSLQSSMLNMKEDVVVTLNLYRQLLQFLEDVNYLPSTGDNFISQTFETVSQNLKQYPYTIQYTTGQLVDSIDYTVNQSVSIVKSLIYDNEEKLVQISISSPLNLGISLNKYFLYSGNTITGVYYN